MQTLDELKVYRPAQNFEFATRRHLAAKNSRLQGYESGSLVVTIIIKMAILICIFCIKKLFNIIGSYSVVPLEYADF